MDPWLAMAKSVSAKSDIALEQATVASSSGKVISVNFRGAVVSGIECIGPVPANGDRVWLLMDRSRIIALSGEQPVLDHGGLTGLGDDDHPFYKDYARSVSGFAPKVESTAVSWDDIGQTGVYQGGLMHGINNPGGPGVGGYYYVHTYTYATLDGTGASRTQVAIPYYGSTDIYIRSYYNGSWYAWRRGNSDYATSAGNADTTDGLHVHNTASNQTSANQILRTQGSGYTMVGYINSSNGNEGNASGPPRVWGTNGSDSYLRSYQSAYLYATHNHSRHNAGYNVVAFDVGTLTAGTSYGPWTVGHGLGQTPGVSMSDVYGDDGVHSIDTGIGVHDSVNCQFNAKNNHTANEACSIVGAHFK